MQRQLQELQGGLEIESDKVLSQLVCAQRVSEMIAQLQQDEQSVDVRLSSQAWTASLDSLLAELNDHRTSEGQHQPHRRE